MSEHPDSERTSDEQADSARVDAGQAGTERADTGQAGTERTDSAQTDAEQADDGQTETKAPAQAPGTKTPTPSPSPRRRRAGVIAGCVVLLAALVGGTGFTVMTVRDADRAPGKPVWQRPETLVESKQPEATGLRGMLLPYGTNGFGRGPDLGEFGADAELSGARATALRKKSLRNLPLSQRRLMEKRFDEQRVRGMAMRSYLSDGGAAQHFSEDVQDAFVVEIVLSRMESRQTVRSIATLQQEFLDALKVFRAGPRIEGYENARCFLPPAGSDDDLDLVFCSAYQGDVLVGATAYGPKPLGTKTLADFLRAQLDRIKDPGKAV
ncbi:hypothetical protein [Streptomyces thermoalcalitolerans]|uniref:Secreted protein n=1 Tax=Streptomyces thermoalcalitolerans TaxID=65605 RepID=A0ABN1P1G5_9ACTN